MLTIDFEDAIAELLHQIYSADSTRQCNMLGKPNE
jgi:hypothetical protein